MGGHDRALLGAGGVLGVAVGQVAAVARLNELPGCQGLGEKTLVGVGVNDLDVLGGEDPGPLGDELADVGVAQPGLGQGCRGVHGHGACHRGSPYVLMVGCQPGAGAGSAGPPRGLATSLV